jgi:hypothetical protein
LGTWILGLDFEKKVPELGMKLGTCLKAREKGSPKANFYTSSDSSISKKLNFIFKKIVLTWVRHVVGWRTQFR